MKDERKNLNNQMELYLWAGLGLLGLHFYIELHEFFAGYGFSHPFTDGFLSKFAANQKIFGSPWPVKLTAGACLVGYGATIRGVKSTTLTTGHVIRAIGLGLLLFLGGTLLLQNSQWFLQRVSSSALSIGYLVATTTGVLYLLKGTQGINRLLKGGVPGKDKFNRENETFPQENRLLNNAYSVNIPTEYFYQGLRRGWLNISAPFRALLVMGTGGSGKTYGIIHQVIRQHIEKGFSMYVYDYKYPSLSLVAYNAVKKHHKKLPKDMKFYVIDFDNPVKSHRCNPLHPSYMTRIDFVTECARMMLMNLNRKWIDKQGEFFVESPINYVTALIWFLRCYDKGQYCTFPHLVELITVNYRQLLPILLDKSDIASYMAPFASAYQGGATEQLEGQISSAQIALARLASPALYWTMSGDDFRLDINNPKAPKIVCLGNNQQLEGIYGAALGLYNYRIMSLMNTPGQHQSSLVVDELPTIYFKGLSKLITTARSNRVAVTIGMQDFSQLEEDYGRTQAETIKNTCGNVISGQVYDKTAEAMQNRMGKIVQQKHSLNIQSEEVTQGISTELNHMAPAAKISQLSQGWMVGVLADNDGQESQHKAFHARIAIDKAEFDQEQKAKEMPDFSIFAADKTTMDERVQANFLKIKEDIAKLVSSELGRLNKKHGL